MMAAGLGLSLVGPRVALAQVAQTAPPPGSAPPPSQTPVPALSPQPAATLTPAPPAVTATAAPAPQWLEAVVPLVLWSGPDDAAVQLGVAAQGDYFQLARPQSGPRLYVLVARTKNYAWLDALSVGPSG